MTVGAITEKVLSGDKAPQAFMVAFAFAPGEEECTLGVGSHSSEPCVQYVMAFVGDLVFALTPHQARCIALGAEETMRQYDDTPLARAMPRLVEGLRACADQCETRH